MRRAMTACRHARSASLFVGDSSGSATKAITASQSLRISRARARTFCSIACSLHWQFHLMRASRHLTAASLRCLSKKLSGAASDCVSDFAVVGVALGVETDVADRRPVADLA